MSGDIILSNGSTITAEELASIAAEVKKLIAKEAKDPSQYEEVGSLANLTTLPALLQNGSVYKLVRVAVELLKGVDGKEVSLRKTDTALQWQLGDGEWQDLLLLADIGTGYIIELEIESLNGHSMADLDFTAEMLVSPENNIVSVSAGKMGKTSCGKMRAYYTELDNRY